nr:hypothetical protein [Tanacetum cinerariifolium]
MMVCSSWWTWQNGRVRLAGKRSGLDQ